MRIISIKALRDFWEKHPNAEEALLRWYQITLSENWICFADVRHSFPQVDLVGCCHVFNAGGNHYRLITKILYAREGKSGHMAQGVVFIRAVLTHREYDKDRWKPDCEA